MQFVLFRIVGFPWKMPRTVNVNTLFQLGINTFVEHFYNKCFTQNCSEDRLKKLLREEVPTCVTNIIVSEVVKMCVQKCKQSPEDNNPKDELETGAVILQLYEKLKEENNVLNLTHINHVGASSQTCRSVHKLHFTEKLMFATQALCPNLQHLKIRVTDYDVGKLKAFSALKSIELVFNTGMPSGPGNGTIHYLQHYGNQLTSLAIVCNFFNEKFFKIIGDCCHNINHLWIRCNDLSCYYNETTVPVFDDSVYTQLETLYFRVGESEFSECLLPISILSYVLGNTHTLSDLRLLIRSELITDMWLSQLWKKIRTDRLEKLLIVLPAQNFQGRAIDLSMASVHMILNSCPNLRKLGNLLVWNISYKEYEGLVTQLKACNYDLEVAFRTMIVR